MKKTTAAKPVSADRFKGTPGEIVSIDGLDLDFTSRVGRKSGYDELLEKLAASPKNTAIRFGDIKCRPSVAARAKKRGFLIQFAESAGQLYVRVVGSATEDLKTARREKITAILKTGSLTCLGITKRLRDNGDETIDGSTTESILAQMRKAGDVVVQEGGNYALSPLRKSA